MKALPVPEKGGPRVNKDIRAREVQVIDTKGENRGAMLVYDAQKLAEEEGLDLVEVAPNSVPPVCKIMDYGRFRFQEQKKSAEARPLAEEAVALFRGYPDGDAKARRSAFEVLDEILVAVGDQPAHEALQLEIAALPVAK